ncbi:MAG: hypothetical protein ABIJ47_01545 [Candidatus Bathyarchaeota archaeon]
MARSYLLTAREREIITTYLDKGVALDGLRELRHVLANLDLSIIDKDRELIDRLLHDRPQTH